MDLFSQKNLTLKIHWKNWVLALSAWSRFLSLIYFLSFTTSFLKSKPSVWEINCWNWEAEVAFGGGRGGFCSPLASQFLIYKIGEISQGWAVCTRLGGFPPPPWHILKGRPSWEVMFVKWNQNLFLIMSYVMNMDIIKFVVRPWWAPFFSFCQV